ncbi:threonine synthase [Cohnella soli]|uniref:Threonine synthase n=1 Tax=Cohnella soli TaxID=425005 RepID=A0ABW0I080_9BACL
MNKCWLRCTRCKSVFDFRLIGKCEKCQGTLLVEYDMNRAHDVFTPTKLALSNNNTLWRYHELLPVRSLDSAITLGEGVTPLIRMPAIEKQQSLRRVWMKREEQNPTGSFKARGFSVTVSLLAERGIPIAAVPSNGNAASAFAAYAARAGIDAHVFIPKDCPPLIVEECKLYGAHTTLVDGKIHDAAAAIELRKDQMGWFNVGTLREPGRVEGKKTMAFEIAEQLGWRLPDVIIYPTGGGSGIVGMWKGFMELRRLGLIQGTLPRLISVQEEGCRPIVDALKGTENQEESITNEASNPTGMRVPIPPDLDLLVTILKETGGDAISVSKSEMDSAQRMLGTLGISSSPEGAATYAGLLKLTETNGLSGEEEIVLFNTSHAMKYSSVSPSAISKRQLADYMI